MLIAESVSPLAKGSPAKGDERRHEDDDRRGGEHPLVGRAGVMSSLMKSFAGRRRGLEDAVGPDAHRGPAGPGTQACTFRSSSTMYITVTSTAASTVTIMINGTMTFQHVNAAVVGGRDEAGGESRTSLGQARRIPLSASLASSSRLPPSDPHFPEHDVDRADEAPPTSATRLPLTSAAAPGGCRTTAAHAEPVRRHRLAVAHHEVPELALGRLDRVITSRRRAA